ncbi:M24 family metallopeptidase [Dinghuibacter silviterrae]|nr:Xaa-Pro peptidase family protein [Dinghuibacter silviterrae]
MNESRKQQLDGMLQQRGAGAFLFWRPDELVLTLGYLPHWGISFLLYPRDGEPVLFVPELEPEDILPAGIAVHTFPWGVLDGPDPWEELYAGIRGVLKVRGLHRLPLSFTKDIGRSAPCRMAGEQAPLPPGLCDRLSLLCLGGYIETDTESLYTVKTPQDIAALEVTHRVATLAVRTFYRNLQPGKTEAAVAAAVEAAVQEATGSEGVDYAKAWGLVQSGINTAAAGRFNRSTGKALAAGEGVLLELSICINGYWADITRVGQTGQLPPVHKKIVDIVAEAQAAAIESMRPGVAMEVIDERARRVIRAAGYGDHFAHGLGHHVGFRYHDPGPGLWPGSRALLRPGMILTVEPGIYGVDIACGARIEDNVLVTEDGYRILSDYYRDLTI